MLPKHKLAKNLSSIDLYKSKSDFEEKLQKQIGPAKLLVVTHALEKKRNKKMIFLNHSSKTDSIIGVNKKSNTSCINFSELGKNDEMTIEDKIEKYDEEFKENIKLYKEKKEENDEFIERYDKIKKTSEEEERPGRPKCPEVVFSDLIGKYRDKGYKVPDLSVNKNLFKPSALLLEDNKLLNYYKSSGNIFNNNDKDKDLQFLLNLNLLIIDRTSNEEEKKLSSLEKKGTINRKLTSGKVNFDLKENSPVNTVDIENEVKQNEIQMKKLREYISKNKVKIVESQTQISKSLKKKNSINSNLSDIDSDKIGNKAFLPSIKTKIFNESSQNTKRLKNSPSPSTTNGTINRSIINNSTFNMLMPDKQNNGLQSTNISLVISNDDNSNNRNNRNNNKFLIPSPIVLHYSSKNKNTLKLSNQNRNNPDQNSFTQEYLNKTNNKISPNHLVVNSKKLFLKDSNMVQSPFKTAYDLESIYEKVLKREQKSLSGNHHNGSIYKDIHSYFTNEKKYLKALDRDKTLPKHLLKNLSNLKFRVGLKDVFSSYTGLSNKIANYELDNNSLYNIKQMDKKINNMEKYLIKALKNGDHNDIDY